MTVYNPYKFAGENLPESLKTNIFLSGFVTKFENMLDISMEYLQEINEIIRNSASENLYVVDIWNLFEGFTNEQYSEYLNVDTASISLTSSMLTDTNLLIQEFKTKCDPHPTYAGHERIAQEHLNVFKYFKFDCQESLSGVKDKDDTLSFNIDTFENGNFTYKLNKLVNNQVSLIKSSQTSPIVVDASDLTGEGKVFVEVYNDSNKIYTTNYLDYNLSSNSHTLSTTSSLTGIKELSENITFTIESTFTEGYTYKLFTKINNVESEHSSLTLSASKLSGKGSVYAKVYKNSVHVDTTNSLNFDIIVNDFSLVCDKTISSSTFDIDEKITLSVSGTTNDDLTYKIFNKIEEQSTLLSQDKSVAVYAIDYQGSGSFYAEVYYKSNLLTTTEEINYQIKINQHTISVDNNALNGLKDLNQSITIKINSTYVGSYTFKLYKSNEDGEVFLKQNSGNIKINATDLIGEGSIFVKVFKNDKQVATTNSLTYNISINEFSFKTSATIQNVILDSTDNIKFEIVGQDFTNYSFRLYKNGTFVSTSTGSSFNISAQTLSGSGSIYLDVYKNYSKIHSTNSLDYSITINEFSFSCDQSDLTGYVGSQKVITFTAQALKTQGYTYKLSKRSGGVTSVLKEVSTPIIEINAGDLHGSGNVFLEVYKGQTLVYKSSNIGYNFNAIDFVISSSVNLSSLENDDQKVYISINNTSIPTPIFMLYRIDNGVKTKIQTNGTGEFELKANMLDGEGELIVEVYSEGSKIAQTNTLQFKYDSKNLSKEDMAHKNDIVLIVIAIVLVVAVIGIALTIVVVGHIKKKKMWKI